MFIKVDDLSSDEVAELIFDHIKSMRKHSPPESKHALDLEALKKPEITFWSAWEDQVIVGCGALQEIEPAHGEVKSMKTAPNHLRKGVAREMLQHIVDEATKRGYQRLSLETGSMEVFKPAVKLYENFGFSRCKPFSNYKEDANSIYMTKEL
ncbi:putative acetyltransferase [Bacillus sp. TS-2]|nr:putative acetyltransferase [Bacillus sp. TS-2]